MSDIFENQTVIGEVTYICSYMQTNVLFCDVFFDDFRKNRQ